MKTRSDFWSAVDAELDARRDPFADESVRAWLLEHSGDALELADLRASLRVVESADSPLSAPRRSRFVPLAAAAGLLVLGIFVGTRVLERATPRLTAAQELELHPIVPAPELCRVHSWEVISTIESVRGTITVRASEGRLSVEHRTADDSSSVEGVVVSSESLVMR